MSLLARVTVSPIRAIAAFSSASGKAAKPKGEGSGRKKSPSKEVPIQPAAVPEPNRPAGDAYRVPEYYGHNIDSYADLNMEMQRYRLPRPVRPRH